MEIKDNPITKKSRILTSTIDSKLYKTLDVLVRLKEYDPVIGGSIGLYLQGVDIIPHDLDLIFQESDLVNKRIIKSKFEDIYPYHIDIQCWKFNIRSITLMWRNLQLKVQPAVDIIACKNEFEELYPRKKDKIVKHKTQLESIRKQFYFE